MRLSLLTTAAALVVALGAPAYAQAHYTGTQITLSPSFGVLDLNVHNADDVSAAATAGGNAVSVAGDDEPVTMNSTQNAHAGVAARAFVTAHRVHDDAVVGAVAAQNSAVAHSNWDNVTITAYQQAFDYASSHARFTARRAGESTVFSTSSANTAQFVTTRGLITADIEQRAQSNVSANVDNHVGRSHTLVGAAVASANNATGRNEDGDTRSWISQTSTGANVRARSDVSGYHAHAVSTAAVANGNAITLSNEWGNLFSRSWQRNSSDIEATSSIQLEGGWFGAASGSAYGVGNAAGFTAYNEGGDINSLQANSGDVLAYTYAGGAGHELTSAAAAFGNAVSVHMERSIGPLPLYATNRQENSGEIVSRVQTNVGNVGSVAASSSAIGNTASYYISRD